MIENDTVTADIVGDYLSQSIEQMQRRIRGRLHDYITQWYQTANVRVLVLWVFIALTHSDKTGLEAKQEQLEQSIVEVFDTPDMRSFTYRLHAVLMYDGSSGSGHHWAYVRVRQTSEDEGQWMRFCDAEVRKVSDLWPNLDVCFR